MLTACHKDIKITVVPYKFAEIFSAYLLIGKCHIGIILIKICLDLIESFKVAEKSRISQ